MTLTILGTGNAVTTECYNTCFVLHESNQYFLVDGGGGSQILHQLKHTGIELEKDKNYFCNAQASRSYYRNNLDDSHDLSVHEAGRIRRRSSHICT